MAGLVAVAACHKEKEAEEPYQYQFEPTVCEQLFLSSFGNPTSVHVIYIECSGTTPATPIRKLEKQYKEAVRANNWYPDGANSIYYQYHRESLTGFRIFADNSFMGKTPGEDISPLFVITEWGEPYQPHWFDTQFNIHYMKENMSIANLLSCSALVPERLTVMLGGDVPFEPFVGNLTVEITLDNGKSLSSSALVEWE